MRENLHGLECLVRAPLGQHITSLAYDTCTGKTTLLQGGLQATTLWRIRWVNNSARILYNIPRGGGGARGHPPSTLAFLAGGSDTQGTAEPESNRESPALRLPALRKGGASGPRT